MNYHIYLSSKWRLDNKSFRDQVKKQNFSTFHMGILEIFADVVLIRAETIKSLLYNMLDYFH